MGGMGWGGEKDSVGLDVLESSLERSADSGDIFISSYVIMCEDRVYEWLVLILPGICALQWKKL